MNAVLAPRDFHPDIAELTDRQLLRELSYIDGRWTAGADGKTFEVSDPACARPIAWVASLEAGQAGSAIDAAANALPGWRSALPQERSRLLRRWHDLVVSARRDLARLLTLEQGKPLAEALGEIDYAASFIEWFAEEGRRLNTESVTSHLADAEMVVRREALGVAAVITPWNFPSAMITRKAAAALAAGCTVVAHPSCEAPLSALALAELAERAGIPPGVFNVVTGDPAAIVGCLTDDVRVRALSFTGSTEIGRLIAPRSAASMKRLVMELGGHAPFIVFADADPDEAARLAVDAKFATSGQDCLAANRIYVERPVLATFLERFAARIAQLRVGPGAELGVDIGPLVHERAMAKIEAQVADARTRGARLVVGGARHSAGPLFYQPTLLANVPDEALIMRQETFGPVAAVAAFDSETEVIARANDSEYGLCAYVVTANGARQKRLARALEYGMVAVNRVKITGGPVPFGGWKQSGVGREGSRHGLDAFSELKYICFDLVI